MCHHPSKVDFPAPHGAEVESETIRKDPGIDLSCQSTLGRGSVSEPFGSRRPDGRRGRTPGFQSSRPKT